MWQVMTFFSLLFSFELSTHFHSDVSEEITKISFQNALEKACLCYVCQLSILYFVQYTF